MKILPKFIYMTLLERGVLRNFFRISSLSRKFFIAGAEVRLRNKEFNLLAYFLKNPGRVITRTELLEDVWDRNICCSTNTVDVHVSMLRRKFRSYFNRDFIKTVNCIGYIFDLHG